MRLRVEKKVGQLDFGNFISSTNFAQNQINAGNPDLRPDQRWQYEAAIERRFWGKGSVVVTLTHETLDDVVDLVPIVGPGFAFDAPGNIGSGTGDTLDIQGTFPLDKLGWKGATITTMTTWRNSEVTDPVTGQTRRISSQRPKSIGLSFQQDLPQWKTNLGINYDQVWTEVSYRLAEVDHRIVTPAVPASLRRVQAEKRPDAAPRADQPDPVHVQVSAGHLRRAAEYGAAGAEGGTGDPVAAEDLLQGPQKLQLTRPRPPSS